MYRLFTSARFGYFALIFFLVVLSCKKSDEPLVSLVYDSVTIVYIEANNDLRQEGREAIKALEKGISKAKHGNTLILAYIKTNDQHSHLFKIVSDKNSSTIERDLIKMFPTAEPTDAAQIHNVLTFIRDTYKSKEYNLILSSHGTAWAPAAKYNQIPTTRSFGEDRGVQVDILELKDALPMPFNYIVFDACSMASVEVLYEFRNKANYIIASPTDVLSEGFPYEAIAPYLNLTTKEGVVKIATAYFDYYNGKSGLFRSATISVADLKKLEKLAVFMGSLNQHQSGEFRTAGVQRMDFTDGFPVILYDFQDFVAKNYENEDLLRLQELLNEVIVYKNSTPEFIGNEVNSFSGLTLSLVSNTALYYPYYAKLAWSKRAKMY